MVWGSSLNTELDLKTDVNERLIQKLLANKVQISENVSLTHEQFKNYIFIEPSVESCHFFKSIMNSKRDESFEESKHIDNWCEENKNYIGNKKEAKLKEMRIVIGGLHCENEQVLNRTSEEEL
jgi:hypothetical protein